MHGQHSTRMPVQQIHNKFLHIMNQQQQEITIFLNVYAMDLMDILVVHAILIDVIQSR